MEKQLNFVKSSQFCKQQQISFKKLYNLEKNSAFNCTGVRNFLNLCLHCKIFSLSNLEGSNNIAKQKKKLYALIFETGLLFGIFSNYNNLNAI